MNQELSLCPSCGLRPIFQVLNIEKAPHSCQKLYRSIEEARKEKVASLDIVTCGNCALLWNRSFVSRASEHYDNDYYCSFIISGEARNHQHEQVRLIDAALPLKQLNILEIGCGDGFFLGEMAERSASATGFEPSSTSSLVQYSEKLAIKKEFFNFSGQTLLPSKPELIIMRHVLEHIPEAASALKHLSGKTFSGESAPYLFIEVPNSEALLKQSLYFDFYNDHVHYFSKTSLAKLLKNAGWTPMEYFDLKDEFLCILARNTQYVESLSDDSDSGDVEKMLESAKHFGDEFESWRKILYNLLVSEKKSGNRIAVWGAGSRGVSLLAGLALPDGFFEFIADKDNNKHGKYTPITHLNIHPVNDVRKDLVDTVLITSYTYFDEIISELKLFRAQGGRVIRIYPQPGVF